MGAVPLAGAIAQLSWIKGHPIAAFFVRKEPKEHGAKLAIEGLAKGESLAANAWSWSRTSPRQAARR